MKAKALVIDDSRVMRRMVMDTLQKAKLGEFDFVEAPDGVEALQKLKENEIDIAFVDWNMPNMSGIDFVREVRKQEKDADQEPIPLVMVTSEKTMGKVQEALDEAGADAFISKPFTAEEMERKLKKSMEKAQMVQLRRLRRQREQMQAAAEPKAAGGLFSKLFS